MFLRVIRRAPQWNLNAIPQQDFPSLCLPSWADPQPLYLRYIKTHKGYFRALLDHVQRGAPSPQWNVSSIKQMCLLFQVVGRLPKKYFRLVRLVWSVLVWSVTSCTTWQPKLELIQVTPLSNWFQSETWFYREVFTKLRREKVRPKDKPPLGPPLAPPGLSYFTK